MAFKTKPGTFDFCHAYPLVVMIWKFTLWKVGAFSLESQIGGWYISAGTELGKSVSLPSMVLFPYFACVMIHTYYSKAMKGRDSWTEFILFLNTRLLSASGLTAPISTSLQFKDHCFNLILSSISMKHRVMSKLHLIVALKWWILKIRNWIWRVKSTPGNWNWCLLAQVWIYFWQSGDMKRDMHSNHI